MSLKVGPQSKPKRPLTLALPSKSKLFALPSLESSSVPPTATSESFPVSTPLNVKFAPLPELSPRKRRSSVPLGMAGRGQLLSRRKGGRAPPMWTDEGPEEYRLQQEELAARQARSTAYAAYAAARQEEEEDDSESKYDRRKKKNGGHVGEDDRFLVLGRIVKGASKTLWKRVSNKDVAVAAAAATSMPKAKEDRNTTNGTRAPPLRPILGNIISNTKTEDHQREGEEEYQWEEEIGNTLLHSISQTETIVEGRVYSHFTSRVEALSRSPPPSPRKMIFMRPPKKLPPSK